MQEGYFNYERDGFGPVYDNYLEIIAYLDKIYKDNKFIVEKKYLDKMQNFFELKDRNNCERHYRLLKGRSR